MQRPRRTRGLLIGLGVIVPLVAALPTAATAQATGRAGPARAKAAGGAPAGEKRSPFGTPRGPGGAGGVTPVLFIQHKAVIDELRLTPDQVERVRRVNDEFDRKRLDLARSFARPDRGLDQDELMATIARLRAENEAALSKTLQPKQRTRLAQIVLQMKGPLAVAEPEVATRLNLGPDQVEMIQAILAEYHQAQGQAEAAGRERLQAVSSASVIRGRGPSEAQRTPEAEAKARDLDPREKKSRAEVQSMEGESERLHQEAVRQVGRVLTRRQKDLFNTMLGPPFDLSALDPRKAPLARKLPPADQPVELEPVPPEPTSQPKEAP